jgi:hypothetical protein
VLLDETATATELPYRLYLSPYKFGAWAHQMPLRTFNGCTELWHTRLGTRKPDDDGVRETGVSVRAIGFRVQQRIFRRCQRKSMLSVLSEEVPLWQ